MSVQEAREGLHDALDACVDSGHTHSPWACALAPAATLIREAQREIAERIMRAICTNTGPACVDAGLDYEAGDYCYNCEKVMGIQAPRGGKAEEQRAG